MTKYIFAAALGQLFLFAACSAGSKQNFPATDSAALYIFINMNVIWLVSWFPNRTDPSLGDFIERHAFAVAPFLNKLTIIVVVKDVAMPVNTVETVVNKQGNIETQLVYYGPSRWGGAADKLLSLRRSTSLYQQAFDKILAKYGLPDLLHVHVAMKAGLAAKMIKKQYQIPYLVTEHSSIFYAEAQPSITSAGWYFRRLLKSILQEADLVLPVSDALGKAINKNLTTIQYEVLPNVVDTSIFFPAKQKENELLQLIHVSGMGYPKNMEAIINALVLLKQKNIPFKMEFYGPVTGKVRLLVTEAALAEQVFFKGEVSQAQLAPALQQADALVLFSRYETFGCVLIEANACGVPVIVSDLPVFHELVAEGVNGVFVTTFDAPALASELEKLAAKKYSFDSAQMAANTAAKFSYQIVGERLLKIYQRFKQ